MQFTPFYKQVTGILFYSNILQNDSISIGNMMENRIFPITILFCFQKSPFFMLYRSVFRRILSQNVVFHKSAE